MISIFFHFFIYYLSDRSGTSISIPSFCPVHNWLFSPLKTSCVFSCGDHYLDCSHSIYDFLFGFLLRISMQYFKKHLLFAQTVKWDFLIALRVPCKHKPAMLLLHGNIYALWYACQAFAGFFPLFTRVRIAYFLCLYMFILDPCILTYDKTALFFFLYYTWCKHIKTSKINSKMYFNKMCPIFFSH